MQKLLFIYLLAAGVVSAADVGLVPPPDKASEAKDIPAPLLRKADEAKSVRLTLEEVEKSFVERNLLLLAAHYKIEAKRALVLQAGLYPNPNVFLETNIYNHQTKQYFDATENGSQVLQVQQLFLLGGKIEKRKNVAKIGEALGENEFYNTLRTLKFELRKTFFALHFMRESILYYDQTIEALARTVKSAEVALSRRAITHQNICGSKRSIIFCVTSVRTFTSIFA